MRTVHETEALRPSDPVPKSMQSGPTGRTGKLKIIIKTPQSHGTGQDNESGEAENILYFTVLPSEMFTDEELTYDLKKLYRKCYWETKWTEDVGEALKKECKDWEEIYYKEWLEKEVLLSQVIETEVDWHERRQAILSGIANVQLPSSDSKEEKPANGVKEDNAAIASTNGEDAMETTVA